MTTHSDAVERMSLTVLLQFLEKLPQIQPEINTNDRGLVTDGFFDLWKSKDRKSFTGRLNIQLKGRTKKNGKKLPGYSLETKKLSIIEKMNGLLWIEVHFPHDGESTGAEIHTALLTPTRCREYLKAKPANKTINIKTTPIESPQQLLQEVEIGIKHTQLQGTGGQPIDFDDLREVRIDTTSPLDFQEASLRLDSETDDFVVTFTFADGRQDARLEGVFELKKTNPTLYGILSSPSTSFTNCKLEYQAGRNCTFTLAPEFTLRTLRDTSHKTYGSFEAQPRLETSLDTLIKLSCFLSELRAGTQLMFDDDILGTFQSSQVDLPLWLNYDHLKEVHRTLRALGVNTETISYGDLSALNLDRLHELEELMLPLGTHLQDAEDIQRVHIPFSTRYLEFIKVQLSGRKRYFSPFDGTILRRNLFSVFEKSNGTRTIVPYEVTVDDFHLIANSNLASLLERLKEHASIETLSAHAPDILLSILNSADSHPLHRDFYLENALELASWLREINSDSISAQINYYQTKARLAPLTTEEQQEIRRIRARRHHYTESDLSFVTPALHILLNEVEDLNLVLQELSEEDRTLFNSWPISHLRGFSENEVRSF